MRRTCAGSSNMFDSTGCSPTLARNFRLSATQAQAFHEQFVGGLNASLGLYVSAESAAQQNLVNAVNAPAEALVGHPAASVTTSPSSPQSSPSSNYGYNDIGSGNVGVNNYGYNNIGIGNAGAGNFGGWNTGVATLACLVTASTISASGSPARTRLVLVS
jgi:hypothetical protein